MEVSIHLRNCPVKINRNDLLGNLLNFLKNQDEKFLSVLDGTDLDLRLIYIGDEFCFNRLPGINQLTKFIKEIKRNGMKLALLTPVMSDINLDAYRDVFDFLSNQDLTIEIVINDWGVFNLIKQNYPSLRLSLGRLLDKGFKDPRFNWAQAAPSHDISELISSSTYDDAEFQKFAFNLGITRLERDMFPYKKELLSGCAQSRFSVYFPYGYITSGRNCSVSTLVTKKKYDFIPLYKCSRPCGNYFIEMQHDQFRFTVFQNGNTVFYQYNLPMLFNLFKIAKLYDIRLIYQGMAL